MIERPQRRSWRAGYLIVPLALLVGVLQFLIPSHLAWVAWLEGPHQEAPAPQGAASPVAAVPDAPVGEPPSLAERQIAKGSGPEVPELGPSDPIERPAQETTPPVERPSAESPPAKSPPAGPSPVAAPIRVFIHQPAGDAVPAIQLAAYLQTHGFEVADIRLVRFAIERPSVRYFFDRDRPATRRLVEVVRAFFADEPDEAPAQAADFSFFSPKPRPGNVEVWLPATGQSRPRHASSGS